MNSRIILIVSVVSAILVFGMTENSTDGNHIRVQFDRNLPHSGISSPPAAKKPRRRRMSCDVLSLPLPFGYANHAACASFCFFNGKNFRGHCEFGWCKCK